MMILFDDVIKTAVTLLTIDCFFLVWCICPALILLLLYIIVLSNYVCRAHHFGYLNGDLFFHCTYGMLLVVFDWYAACLIYTKHVILIIWTDVNSSFHCTYGYTSSRFFDWRFTWNDPGYTFQTWKYMCVIIDGGHDSGFMYTEYTILVIWTEINSSLCIQGYF